MGNNGIRKIFFQTNMVETPYNSLYDISAVTIDKEEYDLSNFKG